MIIESWDYGKQDFLDPCVIKLKTSLSYVIWKRFISAYIEFHTHQDWQENWYFNLQTLRTFVQLEIISVLHNSVVEGRHLVAGFENNGARGSRFERVGSQMLKGNGQIGFPLRNFFFLIFLRPQGTFGTKKSTTGTPSKMALFQKTWWKRVKG